jgi:hypothetical protein
MHIRYRKERLVKGKREGAIKENRKERGEETGKSEVRDKKRATHGKRMGRKSNRREGTIKSSRKERREEIGRSEVKQEKRTTHRNRVGGEERARELGKARLK